MSYSPGYSNFSVDTFLFSRMYFFLLLCDLNLYGKQVNKNKQQEQQQFCLCFLRLIYKSRCIEFNVHMYERDFLLISRGNHFNQLALRTYLPVYALHWLNLACFLVFRALWRIQISHFGMDQAVWSEKWI